MANHLGIDLTGKRVVMQGKGNTMKMRAPFVVRQDRYWRMVWFFLVPLWGRTYNGAAMRLFVRLS